MQTTYKKNSKKKNVKFSFYLRERNNALWESHQNHPFVLALGNGTLPNENFVFYIQQDAKFLNEFIKAQAYAITKTTDPAEIEFFAKRVLDISKGEQSLHQIYGKRFGFNHEKLQRIPMAPANYHYTRHLLYVAVTGTLAEIIAAILPCSWLYVDLARFLLKKNSPGPNHPYRDWLLTYASSDFDTVITWLCDRLDKKAAALSIEDKKQLEEIFLTSMRYELLFWEMAWRMENWQQ